MRDSKRQQVVDSARELVRRKVEFLEFGRDPAEGVDCIGFVLAGVSVMLGMQARKLLLGAAASEETRIGLHRVLMTFPEVEGVMRMLTMQLG